MGDRRLGINSHACGCNCIVWLADFAGWRYPFRVDRLGTRASIACGSPRRISSPHVADVNILTKRVELGLTYELPYTIFFLADSLRFLLDHGMSPGDALRRYARRDRVDSR